MRCSKTAVCAVLAILIVSQRRGASRVLLEPPATYRIAAWSGLALMGLVILAGARETRRRAA